MTNRRRGLTIAITVLLLAAIVAGSTLAWLNYHVEQENKFTYISGGDPGDTPGPVEVQIGETHWSIDTQFPSFKDESGAVVPGSGKGATDGVWKDLYENNDRDVSPSWGVNEAVRFIPGVTINKNPQVRAIGQIPTYVGVRVSGVKVATGTEKYLNMDELIKLYAINWAGAKESTTPGKLEADTSTASKWKFIGQDNTTGDVFFVYTEPLWPMQMLDRYKDPASSFGEMTDPLFTTVVVKDNRAANGNQAVYGKITFDAATNDNPHVPNILVTAYSVQGVVDSDPDWSPEKAMKEEFANDAASSAQKGDWKPVF